MTNRDMRALSARIAESFDVVQARWGERPRVGIVLGTGLSSLAAEIKQPVVFDYAALPHFPQATAVGHAGRLVCGLLNGLPVAAMDGRFHAYEGYSHAEITFPIRVIRALGAETLIVSNAAGGMNPHYASGDIVVIDFKGRTASDNVEHPGMAAQGHHLELGSGRFIPGFEDQLIGKKAGADVEVKVSFPEEYPVPALAGQDAIFDVTIHEIRELAETEIDDEFAQSLGLQDVASLRKAVEEQINRELDQQSRLILKKKLLDKLDSAHDFEIPEGMKKQELENITRQVMMDHNERGGEAELTDDEKDELKVIAERRVRLGLVLAEIGKDNKIRVSDQELQKAVITEAQKYPGQEKRVFDYFSKNRHALEGLRAPIYEDKVVDFILELSEVSTREVTPAQLVEEEEKTLAEGIEKSEKPSKAKKAAKGEDKEKKPAAKKKKASE